MSFLRSLRNTDFPIHQSFVHVKNWRLQHVSESRQLVVFMDGTGNDVRSRTNVRRLFEMTTSRHRPEILTFYDPGVGTGDRFFHRNLGGPFGFGFQRNLRDALTFLAENFRTGDEISIFGFSRGAYSAAILANLISRAGLPSLSDVRQESVVARHSRAEKLISCYYAEIHDAERESERHADQAVKRSGRLPPEERASIWRTAYWESLEQCSAWSDTQNRQRPDITVLGLWDPVDSLVAGLYPVAKVAWSVSDISEFNRHKGHRFHPYAFGPKILKCLMALSLDEQRQPFMVELPDHRLGEPKQYEFVWFVGDHSDVGGGHEGDKDLAGVSMNWMLKLVGHRLLGPAGDDIQVYENVASPRHDLSVCKPYRSAAFRIRGEILGSRAHRIVPDPKLHSVFLPRDAAYLIPVRYAGWKMNIHESVFKRMRMEKDLFYVPGSEAHIIDLAEQGWEAPRIKHGRNPRGAYCPRPFRRIPTVRASSDCWVDHQWTEREIQGWVGES
jgi:hypothetical protein